MTTSARRWEPLEAWWRGRRRVAPLGAAVLFVSACIPGLFDDACAIEPVSHQHPVLFTLLGPTSVAAASCGATVEVNGSARYAHGAPGAIRAAEEDLEPYGVVTASNTGEGGDVFALDGVDPEVLLALRRSDGLYAPLWRLDERDPTGASALPAACRYLVDHARCD
jgi:hypothetical protein